MNERVIVFDSVRNESSVKVILGKEYDNSVNEMR